MIKFIRNLLGIELSTVHLNKCKRMEVRAYANGILTTNGNKGECTGEQGKCGCIHAEINLLDQVPYPDTVYITHSPCIKCAEVLSKAGARRILYLMKYRSDEGIKYLHRYGIEIRMLGGAEANEAFKKLYPERRNI